MPAQRSTEGGWLVLLAMVAILAGVRGDSTEALVLGALLLLAKGVSAIYVRVAAAGLSAERKQPSQAFQDDRVRVTFQVAHAGSLPVFDLELTDHLPADRSPKKAVTLLDALAPGSVVHAGYAADCDASRGFHGVGPVVARVRDPLGLAVRERELGAMAGITVYPRLTRLGAPLSPAGRGARVSTGTASGRVSAHGMDLFGVRSYQPGDDPRRIHWALSARQGALCVREFEDLEEPAAAIYLDLTRLANRGVGASSTVELAVRIAAALTTQLTETRAEFALFARGARDRSVPFGRGLAHESRMLSALAFMKADGDTPLATLLNETADALPHRGVAFVVFTSLALRLEDYVDLLAVLRARGVELVAILIDARTYLRVYEEQREVEQDAIDFDEVAFALVSAGVRVYTIARGQDLAERLLRPIAVHASGARW